MKTYSMLYKMVRRLNQSREKRNRFYQRYLLWNTRQIGKGNLGRQIPRSEVRDMGLAIRGFNRQNEDGHYE